MSGPRPNEKMRTPKAVPFAGAVAAADAEEKKAREKTPALQASLTRLVRLATNSNGAAKRYASNLLKVRKQGLSIDDVAAVLLARLAILDDGFEHPTKDLDLPRAMTELGRINREMAELAAAYREQGRALPSEIVFRLDLATATPPGLIPDDAPAPNRDPEVGDVLEVE